ncbi:MAG: bifunctional 4-hydroxy-2-oxoglutarate aldolase/2-dehydro-3-deoxy-phosphogluconate aldolase [Reichenbachiella sp.]
MNRKETVLELLKEKVIVIVRMKDDKLVLPSIEAMINGGMKCIEITSNTPNCSRLISEAIEKYPNVLIGAGTVINGKIADEVIQAGAQFLVTPNYNKEVIEKAHKGDIPVAVGVLTPTEACDAHESGADLLKLFPADTFSPAYLKALLGPLNKLKIFAVGGINEGNAKEWLNNGASGLGIGSCVVREDLAATGKFNDITEMTRRFIKKINN